MQAFHALRIFCDTDTAFQSGHDKRCGYVTIHIVMNMPFLPGAFKGFLDNARPEIKSGDPKAAADDYLNTLLPMA
jgi:hypothetical protein